MKASPAISESSLLSSRRAISVLARAPKIPTRRANAAPVAAKRVGVVLRRGMRPLEFRRVEEALQAHNMVCAPIMTGQRRGALSDTPVCCLIVTGGDVEPTAVERQMIDHAVRDMQARGAPIIALSNAIELVAEAADIADRPKGDAQAMLLHKEVRFLTGAHQLADAIKRMAGLPEVAA